MKTFFLKHWKMLLVVIVWGLGIVQCSLFFTDESQVPDDATVVVSSVSDEITLRFEDVLYRFPGDVATKRFVRLDPIDITFQDSVSALLYLELVISGVPEKPAELLEIFQQFAVAVKFASKHNDPKSYLFKELFAPQLEDYANNGIYATSIADTARLTRDSRGAWREKSVLPPDCKITVKSVHVIELPSSLRSSFAQKD